MSQRLFISKELTDIPNLESFCSENNIELFAHSFLKFNGLPAELSSAFDIIFFSSPRSVKFFFEQHQLPINTAIACAGATTQKAIEQRGYTVSFVPKESGTISKSADEFSKWVEKRTVLFPISTISNRSYSSLLPIDQRIEITIYQTTIASKEISDSDFYAFTSPSNVNAFFESNRLPQNATIFAWGETTKASLEKFTNQRITCLKSSSELGLIEELKQITS